MKDTNPNEEGGTRNAVRQCREALKNLGTTRIVHREFDEGTDAKPTHKHVKHPFAPSNRQSRDSQ
jgi:hypothetical protein